MKKRNYIITVVLAVVLAIVVFGIYNKLNTEKVVQPIPNESNALIVGDYLTTNDLLDAPYIVEGKVKSISEPFEYGYVPFVEIEFEISEVIHSDKKIDNTITILREHDMFTKLQNGQDYILYLYDYEGPVAENVKMICGGNLGAFEILEEKTGTSKTTLKSYKERLIKRLNEN